MRLVIAVAFGGGLGSVLRYLVQKALNSSFPIGTFAVNLIGCFLAGVILAWVVKGMNEAVYLFFITGFCGGFTTFSAFSVENVQMMMAGRWMTAVFYSFISIAGGLLATFTGYKIFNA